MILQYKIQYQIFFIIQVSKFCPTNFRRRLTFSLICPLNKFECGYILYTLDVDIQDMTTI